MGTKTITVRDVRVGDVWADNDKRTAVKGGPRTITITEVEDDFVTGRTNTNRTVEIQRSRMRPTSTGYRLIERDGKAVT